MKFFFTEMLRGKGRVIPILAFTFLGFVVVLGGYFVTGERSFDDRGRAQVVSSFLEFGGLYTTKFDGDDVGCYHVNNFTKACSCPEGFTSVKVGDWVSSSIDWYSCLGKDNCGVEKFYCAKKVEEETAFGGMYSEDLDASCRYPNFATNSCSCPEGFLTIPTLEFDNPSCKGNIYTDGNKTSNCGFLEHYCVSPSVLTSESFVGLYTKNEDGTCRYSNHSTQGCFCPSSNTQEVIEESPVWDFVAKNCEWYGDDGRETCGVHQYSCSIPLAGIGCKVDADCRKVAPYEICFQEICLRGDVNNDGKIGAEDFKLLKADTIEFYKSGWKQGLRRSDFNIDDRISLHDYSWFVVSYRIYNGLDQIDKDKIKY